MQLNIETSTVIKQSNMKLSSIAIDLSHKTDRSDWANIVLYNLICSNFDSEQGLRLILEKAMNNPPTLNLERPAVVRQYFGNENEII